jgi:hypothetical protein
MPLDDLAPANDYYKAGSPLSIGPGIHLRYVQGLLTRLHHLRLQASV